MVAMMERINLLEEILIWLASVVFWERLTLDVKHLEENMNAVRRKRDPNKAKLSD
jgi:hypothetical protein